MTPHSVTTVLIHPHDAATDDEWRDALQAKDFGQLITTASADTGGLPIVVPTHFVFDGQSTIELHLAKANPVWSRLEVDLLAMLTIIDAYVYIPSSWNAVPPRTAEQGVPTSYYASVQATGRVEIVDEPDRIAAILRNQLAHFQPDGGHATVDAEPDGAYTKLLGEIRGIRLTITNVRAKFKYGGNRTPDQRATIAAALEARNGHFDADARDHLLGRTPP